MKQRWGLELISWGLIGFFLFCKVGSLGAQNIWQDEPQIQKDYLRLLKERAPRLESEVRSITRSTREDETNSRLSGRWWWQERWRGMFDWHQWQSHPQPSLNPSGKTTTFTTYRLGTRYETLGPAQVEVWGILQGQETGGILEYQDYWQPWRWQGAIEWHVPWNENLQTRQNAGKFDRLRWQGSWTWDQGRWSWSVVGRASRYYLETPQPPPFPFSEETEQRPPKISEFETREQVLEMLLTRSWYGRWNWGISLIGERGVVQKPQAPVILPDRLNHGALGHVDTALLEDLTLALEATYQYRHLAQKAASSWRVELLYDPLVSFRGWWGYEVGTSDELNATTAQELRWKAGAWWGF